MDDIDKDGVVLAKGINFAELMSSGSEFNIDVNFKDGKKRHDPFLIDKEDFLQEDSSEDSDAEEILKNIEQSADVNLLGAPDYLSFAELATRMTDCIPTGEVKILILEEGDGPLVPYDAQVTIHYAAYWEKETTPFDCTLSANMGAPKTFRLGLGQFLPGLEIGLTTVRGGSARFHLLLEPAAAWGERGVPPRIRAAPALFAVTLLAVRDLAAVDRFNDLPSEDQKKFEVTIKTVKSANSHAEDLFKKKLYSKAIRHYHKSLTVLQISCPKTPEEIAEIKKLQCRAYLNLAVCYSKLKMGNKVLLFCDDLARITNIEENCKGLFYYGKAFLMLGEYDDAKKYFKKALKLEPKNADIGKALADLDDILNRAAKKEKEMWQTAFKSKVAAANEFDDVDEEFKKVLTETCQDLAGRNEYTKFDLPTGLMKKEVDFIKSFVQGFETLSVLEDGEGSKKKLSVVRRLV